MTFGIEAHWWKRPTFEKDLFLFLLTVGFLTVWLDRRLVSEVLRRERSIKAALKRELDGPSYGEHPSVPIEATRIPHAGTINQGDRKTR